VELCAVALTLLGSISVEQLSKPPNVWLDDYQSQDHNSDHAKDS
jgi:hypothetical protein